MPERHRRCGICLYLHVTPAEFGILTCEAKAGNPQGLKRPPIPVFTLIAAKKLIPASLFTFFLRVDM
jgi:hypothetical protein